MGGQIPETAESGNPPMRVYFAIAPDVERRGIKVWFLPRATVLCQDKFAQLSPQSISFEAQTDGGILFPVNSAEWEIHREELTEFTETHNEALAKTTNAWRVSTWRGNWRTLEFTELFRSCQPGA